MNKANFKNSQNKYPVSTDVLDFMQEQINFVSTLSSIAGGNAILKQSTSDTDGLLVLNGELLLIKKSAPNTYITVTEEKQSIVAKGETFKDARVIRYAQYTSNSMGSNSYAATEFKFIENLIAQKELNQHHVPKGTVIDWYGEASFDNIPYGWVPCGGFYVTSTGSAGEKPSKVKEEERRWKERYSSIKTECLYGQIEGGWKCTLRLKNVNSIEIPNLSGRFIVGAGWSDNTSIGYYKLGVIGGENAHILTANESGLPSLSYEDTTTVFTKENKGIGVAGSYNVVTTTSENVNKKNIEGKGAEVAHENRPPYFAMYKLIKVI